MCEYQFCIIVIFFFFKQKTAYEMRISDWSSDVCSSDLTKLQRSSPDGRAASIAVIGGQDGCARSKLIDGTGTGYLASDRQRAGAVELERAIVRNVACKGARCATISDSERSGGYCRSTAIAMITGQGEEAAVLLSKAFEGSDACAVERDRKSTRLNSSQ